MYRDKRAIKMVKMQVRSVAGALGRLGIKVGDFHMLERASTPVYIDFVIMSIVNLLVTL